MISAKNKDFSEQKHANMLDGEDHSVELNFVSGVIALRAGEGPRKESHWMLQARVFKLLLEHCADHNATAVAFENEGTIGIRQPDDSGLK